jgi:ribosome maturation factor RimP
MGKVEQVREIVERVAQPEGIEVVDVELHGRGPGSVLRIYLDRPGGITHEDCQRVSREVGTILDVEDVMESRYTLEVSSPGLDRRMVKPSDYERFVGNNIKIMLKVPQDGRRRFQGLLLGMQSGRVRVEDESGSVVEIPAEQIEKANLVPDFGGKFGSQPRPKH